MPLGTDTTNEMKVPLPPARLEQKRHSAVSISDFTDQCNTVYRLCGAPNTAPDGKSCKYYAIQ
jgi:hypothetical protein